MIPSLYIHIPFCKRKCNYCDFVSYAGKEKLIDAYVEALVNEITALTHFIPTQKLSLFDPLPKGEGNFNSTIYFGGGTPTLLTPKHFEKILKTLPPSPSGRGARGVRAVEVTLEANPGTADKAELKALRQLGINRLSIGAQTFNDHHLKTLGRIHSAEEIFRFFEDARSAGFDNINLDLIFALPNQTFEEWKSDLHTALALAPEHLSTYNLQIEEGTPLWEMIWKPAAERRGFLTRRFPSTLQIPNEDEELEMYEYTIETLNTAGFRHYEISNFARPGFECQHNIVYWKNGNYLGIGTGAHSHINGKRWANPDSVETYIGSGGVVRNVNRQTSDNSLNTTDQRETLFMGLRMLEGLDIGKFQGFEKEVAELIEEGLLTRENNHYKLTRKGLYLGNLVFEKFV